MMKPLRLSLVSMLLMICGIASAQSTVTFTAGTDVGTTTASSSGADQITKDGVTIAIGNGAMAEPQYRVYKNSTFTVSSTVGNITKIEMSCTASGTTKQGPGCLENPTTGTYSYEGTEGVWTGEATEVQFSTPTNQCRMTLVVVYINGGGDTPKPEMETVDNIAAFKALENNKEAKLTLTNAEVLYAGASDMFVRDNTGAIDFYNTGLSFKAGQVLNGSVIGKYTVYNGLPELAKTANTNADDITATEGTVAAKEIGLDEVAGFVCDLIVIKGVTLVQEGNNWYATNEDGDKVQVYDKFKLNYTPEADKTYDITGIVVPYKESFEIAPTEDFTGAAEIPATPVASIADLLQLESPSTNLELTLTNAQVLFNDGNYIYLRENGAAVCFYSAPADLKTLFANNAIVNGKVPVDYEVYRLMPEVKTNVKTPNHTLTATEGEAVVPVETTVEEIAAGSHVCDLVSLKATLGKEVTYKEDGVTVNTTTYYLVSGDVKIVVVNNSKNLNKIEEGTEIEVVGIVNTNNNAYQVKLVKNAVDPTGIDSIVAGKTVGETFNLAGQRVNASYKGVVIVGGKKMIAR